MTNIGFLGLGKMGAAMVERLVTAGHTVTVWNRTRQAADDLAAKHTSLEGAGTPPITVAESPAAAVEGKEIVFSMLFDDQAYEETFLGHAIDSLPEDSLHIACGTMSVTLSEKLTREHAARNQHYLAAPVFGRPNVAAEGKLWIIAAGPEESVALARPMLASMSRGLTVVGDQPAQAHALKLAGNFLITMMIQGLSEAAVFAQASGLDPAAALETLNSALFQSPFYESYSKVMLDPPESPGATVLLGQKDLRLFLEAAHGHDLHLAIAEKIDKRFEEAIDLGLGKADWASGMLEATRNTTRN